MYKIYFMNTYIFYQLIILLIYNIENQIYFQYTNIIKNKQLITNFNNI